MNRGQKIGFIGSALTFLLLGIVFYIFGSIYEATSLLYQSYFWIPGGALYLGFVIWLIRREP
jgi:hypothetical protein